MSCYHRDCTCMTFCTEYVAGVRVLSCAVALSPALFHYSQSCIYKCYVLPFSLCVQYVQSYVCPVLADQSWTLLLPQSLYDQLSVAFNQSQLLPAGEGSRGGVSRDLPLTMMVYHSDTGYSVT